MKTKPRLNKICNILLEADEEDLEELARILEHDHRRMAETLAGDSKRKTRTGGPKGLQCVGKQGSLELVRKLQKYLRYETGYKSRLITRVIDYPSNTDPDQEAVFTLE